jgi:tRNA(Ile)-lysidine synthase
VPGEQGTGLEPAGDVSRSGVVPVRRAVTEALRRRVGRAAQEQPLVVAFSGGLDSCVLLHVLRFGDDRPPLVAAHFDHAMRPGSAADAAWAAGVCRAWNIPFRTARASVPPASEGEARRARYDFLARVGGEAGSGAVLTAHHADDQAETVLFRAVRGTGIGGLRGIPPVREPGVVRPLLELWREELEAYAAEAGIRWREDPTNEHLGFARNALRHEILPALEERVAPGVRRALVRLAAHARAEEAAWDEVLDVLLGELGTDGASLDAEGTAALGEALRAKVLRKMAKDLGTTLDEAATRRAVRFASVGRSGTGIELGGGLELRRELDVLRFVRRVLGAEADVDAELVIGDVGPGHGTVTLGGRRHQVRWGPGPASVSTPGTAADELRRDGGSCADFAISELHFPLHVRGRRPGDRIRRRGGTRLLKKLLAERRVPSLERASIPIVTDAEGTLLWVVGVAMVDRARRRPPEGGDHTMTLEITR